MADHPPLTGCTVHVVKIGWLASLHWISPRDVVDCPGFCENTCHLGYMK